MNGLLILYTAGFIAYGLMELLGLMPQEMKSAGLTLPGIFDRLYGDPNLNFVMYQVRRSTITVLVHSSLPIFYCFGLSMIDSTFSVMSIYHWTMVVALVWMISIVTILFGLAVVYYWYRSDWENHPLILQLGRMGQPWRNIASSINLEFRDINKFVSVLGGNTVVVTDSWILQCNVHTIDILHQKDAILNVASSDEHRFSMDGQSGQFITVNVNSSNTKFKSFSIRLKSYQYTQLRDRLLSPIYIARNVIIHQSLGDRFTAAFAEQVERNGVYILPSGSPKLEHCVGCLQSFPEVKLQKLCADLESGPCRQCFCRPAWCLSCMSKWFASRQDQLRPEGWMASRAPCPMCRATFCMLDVQTIQS